MRHCRNCGAEISDHASFCPACGLPVQSRKVREGGEKREGPKTRHEKRLLFFAILAGITILAILFSVGWIFPFKQKDPLTKIQNGINKTLSVDSLDFELGIQNGNYSYVSQGAVELNRKEQELSLYWRSIYDNEESYLSYSGGSAKEYFFSSDGGMSTYESNVLVTFIIRQLLSNSKNKLDWETIISEFWEDTGLEDDWNLSEVKPVISEIKENLLKDDHLKDILGFQTEQNEDGDTFHFSPDMPKIKELCEDSLRKLWMDEFDYIWDDLTLGWTDLSVDITVDSKGYLNSLSLGLYGDSSIQFNLMFTNFNNASVVLPERISQTELTQEQAVRDIRTHAEDYYSQYDLGPWSVNVKWEDIYDGMINVRADAFTSNEYVNLNLEYQATFYLYDTGWYMGNIEVIDHSYQILSTRFTEADAQQYIDGENNSKTYYNAVLVDHEVNLNTGQDYYTFEATRYDDYWGEQRDTIEVRFKFSVFRGWYYSETKYKGDNIVDLRPWESGLIIAPEFG